VVSIFKIQTPKKLPSNKYEELFKGKENVVKA
jgi:hypothetical protein